MSLYISENDKRIINLDIASQILDDDAVIDVMVVNSDMGIVNDITENTNVKIYPLIFPYLGLRGELKEIKKIFNDMNQDGVSTGSLAHILGSQPLNISQIPKIDTKIIKNNISATGKGTIIGIIDTGIDYTNPNFIDNKGESRIISIWDQTIGEDSTYGYGTIYSKEQINKALDSLNPFSIVPHIDEWGEGTILAGIAAGASIDDKNYYKGVASDAELAVVKVKPASASMQEIYHTTYNPLGFSSLDVALAVQFLVELSIREKKPIAICLPLGTNSGSHDGTNIFDVVLSSYAYNRGVSMVLAAGDEANKGNHASGDLKQEKNQQVNLIIPKGQSGFMIEIWASFGDVLEIELKAPNNISIILNKSGNYSISETSKVWSQGSSVDIDTGCQVIRFRIDKPLEGVWEILIKAVEILEGIYNIWIPKHGMILDRTVLSPFCPFTTIHNSSAAIGLISVACYDSSAKSPYLSSGRGFTRDNRVKPDFMVEGVTVEGPLPGDKFGHITGTTVSSAITAGICSLVYQMQHENNEVFYNTPVMRARLVSILKRELTVNYPDPSRGYGLLDINFSLY